MQNYKQVRIKIKFQGLKWVKFIALFGIFYFSCSQVKSQTPFLKLKNGDVKQYASISKGASGFNCKTKDGEKVTHKSKTVDEVVLGKTNDIKRHFFRVKVSFNGSHQVKIGEGSFKEILMKQDSAVIFRVVNSVSATQFSSTSLLYLLKGTTFRKYDYGHFLTDKKVGNDFLYLNFSNCVPLYSEFFKYASPIKELEELRKIYLSNCL